MVPVQDVDITTNKSKKMRIMLRSEGGGFFVSLQELLTEGSYAGLYSEFSSPLFRFIKADQAFEYAVKAVRLFLSYNADDISAVNNPCNCELLSAQQERAVLSTLGLAMVPSVNK